VFLKNVKDNKVFLKELFEGEQLIKDNPDVIEITQEEFAEHNARHSEVFNLSDAAHHKLILFIDPRDWSLFKARLGREGVSDKDVAKAVMKLVEEYGLGANMVMPKKRREENAYVRDHKEASEK